MQTFRFDDPYETWWAETQLADLAVALSGTEGLQVSYALHSVFKPVTNEVTISTFWEALPIKQRLLAQKADVYLRVIGNRLWTDWDKIMLALNAAEGSKFPKLFTQIVCAAEDSRLVNRIVHSRPGTKESLRARAILYANHLHQNRRSRLQAQKAADIVFADVYRAIIPFGEADSELGKFRNDPLSVSLNEAISLFCRRVCIAKDTTAVVDASVELMERIECLHLLDADATNSLFAFDVGHLRLRDQEHVDGGDSESAARKSKDLRDSFKADAAQREEIEVWTQEQNSRAPGAFSMETNDDESSPSSDTRARMGSDRPTSVETRRGHSDAGRHDDSGEADRETSVVLGGEKGLNAPDSVRLKTVDRKPVTWEAREKVGHWHAETDASQRKLVKLFDRVLLHKMQARQHNARYGRLDKRLTRLLTDPHPHLFYHKAARDNTFDVAVQVLVDCSGSMYDKLEALKPLIYLLHATCRRLQIAHDVCGFWEDTLTTSVAQTGIPVTHLLHAISWSDGARSDVAGHIDELEPQLDNRDGFAIREVGKLLLARPEREKWMIVLSDGEPAAQDYRDAVLDTKNAVRTLVSQGVHVMHLCLIENNDTRLVEAMKQMYGPGCLVVPGINELPKAMDKVLSTLIQRSVL
ncbi:cobaltochelatase CobT-related protein [Alicyclobacillus dauci]|uniref:VWFA domain-containing protein n=1 Tax=Alicyclobacillus dauci TaxID=1475485 RepID=A0ABY6YXX1_9BACL|nr:hypothetical protein [Alicyclobacillus dauci]WAH35113.1 hypothetical protein NZD86_12360 [Alicyclobacillus dauci]